MWAVVLILLWGCMYGGCKRVGWSDWEIFAPNDPLMFLFWCFIGLCIFLCFIMGDGKKK